MKRSRWNSPRLGFAASLFSLAFILIFPAPSFADNTGKLDKDLQRVLRQYGFTGRVESTLEQRLGRSIDPQLANLGRMLFFDVAGGLHNDNACAGCHAPTNGWGDTQSIAIGIQSNQLVGPNRQGPRNQRRTPSVANAAFYPKVMLNGRFSVVSGDPFDNSQGFSFPAPEGTTSFPANDPGVKHLLMAHGQMPPTEMTEVAGFTGTRGTGDPRFDQFDDGLGTPVPPPDASGFRNDPIRAEVLKRLNGNPNYRQLFANAFPEVAAGSPIDFSMFGRAIAEFEFTQVYATAPIDRFAQGDTQSMTASQKRGALLFFGKAGCVSCHAVSGQSNEMFSDFQNHNIAVPQIAPDFGVGKGNVIFDGPNEDEDYGAAQVTGLVSDRYKFRTSPLRNVALQPAFFHDGAFTTLEDAVQHHLDVQDSARNYDPAQARVASDLRLHVANPRAMLSSVDPQLQSVSLNSDEFADLVAFVRFGLLDPRAMSDHLCQLVPASVPSGMPMLKFEGCPAPPPTN